MLYECMQLNFCAIDEVLCARYVYIYIYIYIYIRGQFMLDFTDWSGAHNIHSKRTQLLSPSDRWHWCFYSSTFTGSVSVLVVRHVHTFTFKRLSVSDIRRSISGGLHMYISSYIKDFLPSFQRYLFLLLMTNSQTKFWGVPSPLCV